MDGVWSLALSRSTVLGMASDTDLRRRVSRLENETSSLYEIVTEIKSTLDEHTERFGDIDRRFDGIDARLDTMDQRFDTMGQRFAGVDQQLQEIGSTLTEVVRRLPEPS